MSSITPSIGRKVWLWMAGGYEMTIRNEAQAIDATVVFVDPDSGHVTLDATDHAGNRRIIPDVELVDPTNDTHGSGRTYATWMPYQVTQAVKTVEAVPEPTAAPDPSEAPSAT